MNIPYTIEIKITLYKILYKHMCSIIQRSYHLYCCSLALFYLNMSFLVRRSHLSFSCDIFGKHKTPEAAAPATHACFDFDNYP